MKKRVVVTGMGVLAPNGKDIQSFWDALIKGQSAVSQVTAFDTRDFDVKIGAEIKDFDPSQYVVPGIYRKIDRFAQLGVCAAKQALDDAELSLSVDKKLKIGTVIGTGLGGMIFHEEQIITVIKEGGPSKIMASSVPRISPNSVSAYIGIAFGIKGPNLAVSTACSSGANAVGQAAMMIRSGMIDACVTGGVEAPLTPVTFAGYQALRCLSARNDAPNRASRPFDRDRDGFVLGEGAGIVILESLEHAQRRKAKIYAEIKGYGNSCGAYNMVAPQPDGLDAAHAIRIALENSGVTPDEVDYINAHGTSTALNDVAETKAIKAVFGERASGIPVSSTKSMIGHTIGAAGAIEAIASILSLHHQVVHPTINYETKDPECDLWYVPNKSINQRVNIAISNSFGFGSNNAVLVFGKY